MKQSYKLTGGQAVELEVNSAVPELLATFDRENKNAERNKRRRNEISIDALHEETGWELTDASVDIEIDYLKKEEKETLIAAVLRLSEKQRRLIRLRYYEKKTVTEIATILDIHHSNVIRQLETIHNILKKYFEKLL